jgi:hypothetical protein
MKIAILVSGQPRFIEQGAEWIKNRVFNKLNGYDVDFYVYFWDNGDPNLEEKIQSSYNPVEYKISNFGLYLEDFKNQIQEKNKSLSLDFRLVPTYIRENILFDTPQLTDYGKNFWGQFLSAYEVSNLVKNYHEYDIIIKTRSDAVFDPMDPKVLKQTLKNIKQNKIFNTKIFTPWLQTIGGISYFCDFVFIATPETWINYSQNLRENCIKLATVDKALFYEFNIHEFHGISHWVWNKLSIYSLSGFLSFTVAWPMNFRGTSLIRENIDISNMSYAEINHRFVNYNR